MSDGRFTEMESEIFQLTLVGAGLAMIMDDSVVSLGEVTPASDSHTGARARGGPTFSGGGAWPSWGASPVRTSMRDVRRPSFLSFRYRPRAVVRCGGTEGVLVDHKAVVRHMYLIAPVLSHFGSVSRKPLPPLSID